MVQKVHSKLSGRLLLCNDECTLFIRSRPLPSVICRPCAFVCVYAIFGLSMKVYFFNRAFSQLAAASKRSGWARIDFFNVLPVCQNQAKVLFTGVCSRLDKRDSVDVREPRFTRRCQYCFLHDGMFYRLFSGLPPAALVIDPLCSTTIVEKRSRTTPELPEC